MPNTSPSIVVDVVEGLDEPVVVTRGCGVLRIDLRYGITHGEVIDGMSNLLYPHEQNAIRKDWGVPPCPADPRPYFNLTDRVTPSQVKPQHRLQAA